MIDASGSFLEKEVAHLRTERDAAIAERDAERERCAAIAEEMACGPFVEQARVMAGAVAGAIREGGRSGVQLAAIIRKAERVEVLEKALREILHMYPDGFDEARALVSADRKGRE